MTEAILERNALRWSLIGHILLLATVLVKGVVFPEKIVPYIPTLRVDIVALPDVLKKDQLRKSSSFEKEISKILKETKKEPQVTAHPKPAEQKKAVVKEPKEPDGMKIPDFRAKSKKLEDKNKAVLSRLVALAKIQDSTETPRSKSELIKGNKLSAGSSLSSEAREALQGSYYDLVSDRLKANWTLPPWMSRQQFSAQVKIFIDSKGNLQNFLFVKGSGNNQFDEAVKRSIRESGPFPTPPKQLEASLRSSGILVGFPL